MLVIYLFVLDWSSNSTNKKGPGKPGKRDYYTVFYSVGHPTKSKTDKIHGFLFSDFTFKKFVKYDVLGDGYCDLPFSASVRSFPK